MQEKPDQERSILEPRVDSPLVAETVQAGDAASAAPRTDRRASSPADTLISPKTALTILTVLALFYTLYFARTFLLPLTFALLLDFLLSPAVRALTKLRIPTALGAAIVVVSLLGLLVLGVYQLSGPVQDWAAKAPQSLATAQKQLKKILRPIERVTRTAEQVEDAAGGVSGTSSKTQEVVVKTSSVSARLLGSTKNAIASILEVVLLLYFLLAAGDLFLTKLIKVLPHLQDKLKAVRIARETEAAVSTYLLANLATNVGEGILLAVALHFMGMPNPILWGVLAALLEFVPYLGPLVMVLILGVAGLGTFPTTGQALAIPGVFLLINFFQANIITPLLLSSRLALNPVAQLVGLSLFFWLWGIPGTLLAVPLLATFKIFCDHIEGMGSIGEFLGERHDRRPSLPG